MDARLAQINTPDELRQLNINQLESLSAEIRDLLIKTVGECGGHLAPNLGVVELALALHYAFNTPEDRLIWDVGHQSYVHKILTERRPLLSTLRQYKGLCGFPNRRESAYDAFGTGHSSTSISAGLGMAIARDLAGSQRKIVPIIGDGALTGGMALEALNHAGHLGSPITVVLNDNERSIADNVGGLAQYLSRLRTAPVYSRGKEECELLISRIPSIGPRVLKSVGRVKDSLKHLVLPGMLFEELGFTYLGPIDGHNIPAMVSLFRQAQILPGPVLLHVHTHKGKGYAPAENNPVKFHGLGPFNPKTGATAKSSRVSYTEVFGDTLVKLAQDDQRIVAITAAMTDGTGLTTFAEKYPDRFFDVGIAEQHAVTFAAGLAADGYRPVAAIYSTFLQRAYDQVLHDVCLQNLPMVMAMDRGGIVGEDGATHHGLFDLSFLRTVPNLVLGAPKDENELQHMLKTAIDFEGPVAIRYPRGAGTGCKLDERPVGMEVGRAELLKAGKDLTILAIGNMVPVAVEAAEQLAQQGVDAAVINARWVKPLDEELLCAHIAKTGKLLTIEENVLSGGFGSAVLEMLVRRGMYKVDVRNLGIPDQFVEHGDTEILRSKYGLSAENIVEIVTNDYCAPVALNRRHG